MNTFKAYQNRPILDKQGNICNGSYIIDEEMTIRVKDGFLNDDIDPDTNDFLPAIELANGTHYEHWKDGLLHCDNGPAVVDLLDNYQEWWQNGKQVPPQK